MRQRRLDTSGEFFKRNCKIVEALSVVALKITKQKKPHTIAETLIKPCVLVVEGRPVLQSSSTYLQPFSKRLCHSKICILDISINL